MSKECLIGIHVKAFETHQCEPIRWTDPQIQKHWNLDHKSLDQVHFLSFRGSTEKEFYFGFTESSTFNERSAKQKYFLDAFVLSGPV